MPGVSLDLPSNVLMLRTLRAVVPIYIRAGEKPYSRLLPNHFGIMFKIKFCMFLSLYFVYWRPGSEKEKVVNLNIRIFHRLLGHHFGGEVKRCFIYIFIFYLPPSPELSVGI